MRSLLLVAVVVAVGGCGDDGTHHLADAPPLPIDAAIDSPDPQMSLTATIAGTGSGTVTSSPAGIACMTGSCSHDFDPDTAVTLTAVPDTGSVFVSWGGACSGSTPTCDVTLAQATSVTATFDVARYAVTVTKSGAGSGTIAGNGINCGGTCTVMVDHGTMISLTQTPANLSVFAGWGGACTGTAGCMVTVTGPTSISANFALDNLTLFVAKGGNGAGTVTATGINCGADCSESYTAGQMVTLTAAASTGSTFTGWSGGGCNGTGACTVTVTAATTVTATFTLQQFALTVAKTGTGSGNVASTPTGIACGTDCMENYDYNTMVTLTATPSSGSSFTGWSGACAGAAMCVVSMTQARGVTATFTLQQFALTTTVTGNGSVTSSPVGIACPTDCAENYTFGQVVTLTAAAGAGSTFQGWGGACAGAGTCMVTIDAAKSVTASFTLNNYLLTVNLAGNGAGTVTGTGISCGVDCTELLGFGTMVTLTATANTGSAFAGWSGACTGIGACIVTIDAAKSVTATFNLQTFTLTTTPSGNGTGTVTSSPAGIACPGDCSEIYNYGQMVTLTPAPGAGSTFTGWSGACLGTGACTVTMTAARSVTATFTLMTFALTVTPAGAGTGTVTSAPAGINCGATCTGTFNYNQMITLSATASTPSSTFGGWSGGGCSGTGTCTVTITAATAVTATFNVATYQLDVARAGTGGGTVTSSPAGINCPSVACMTTYNYSTSVMLTATADGTSDLIGWSGAGCSGTSTCTVSMTQARSVTATFNKKQYTLTIFKGGDGGGAVTDSANGINCTSFPCNVTLSHGTSVSLTATPGILNSNLSTFTGWSGACTGTAGCALTITGNIGVTAGFKLKPNLMFTTSTQYDGNLGGLSGADAKCQALATARGLGGTYRAYLGATGINAPSRFAGASGWTRVDGATMVNAIGEFGTTTLANAPRLDEAGNDLSNSATTAVWTATKADTTYFGANCNTTSPPGDWNTVNSTTSYGRCNTTNASVIIDKFTACNALFRLYCFGTDRAATVP